MTEDIDLDKGQSTSLDATDGTLLTWRGIPYRAEFCRGPMVTTVDFPRTHSFVGIKKYAARHPNDPSGSEA